MRLSLFASPHPFSTRGAKLHVFAALRFAPADRRVFATLGALCFFGGVVFGEKNRHPFSTSFFDCPSASSTTARLVVVDDG